MMYAVVQHWKGGGRPPRHSPCGHKHRSFKAARRCAKGLARGIYSDGSRCCVCIYESSLAVEQGRVVQAEWAELEQWQACGVWHQRGNTTSWRTVPAVITKGSPLYMAVTWKWESR